MHSFLRTVIVAVIALATIVGSDVVRAADPGRGGGGAPPGSGGKAPPGTGNPGMGPRGGVGFGIAIDLNTLAAPKPQQVCLRWGSCRQDGRRVRCCVEWATR